MYKNYIVPKVSSATLFSLFSPRKAVCDLLLHVTRRKEIRVCWNTNGGALINVRKTERGAAGLPGWREAVVGVKQKAFSRSAAP